MFPGVGTLINGVGVLVVGLLSRLFFKKSIKNFEKNLPNVCKKHPNIATIVATEAASAANATLLPRSKLLGGGHKNYCIDAYFSFPGCG